ncbi:MAG: hypothetical protein HUU21_35455 [Polyangiaceae bacterium]|nr:hypothetical protein [Polyangiaceae bacterium]
MKAMKVLGTLLAIGLGLSVVGGASDAQAQARGKKTAAPPAVAAEPPDTKSAIKIAPATLTWGMAPKKVAEVVDTVLDEDYKPLYKKVSPGVKMKALDAQLAEEKSAFRRSRIDFGKLPTGIDSTPLRGEYTYLNKESMMSLTRNGQTRYFFFIQDKLWKIIDEHKLVEGHPLGKTWEEAVIKHVKLFGVPGRVLEADYEKGRNATEVDWKDAATHVRVVQRGDTAIAVVLEDRATLSNLASLRPNKPAATDDIDPAVAAAIRGSKAPEPPPPPADKAGSKKK